MDYNDAQTVFQCLSYLLSYPNREWRDGLTDCLELAGQIEDTSISKKLSDFITESQNLHEKDLVETYVYTFDFGKKTNLYITYMNSGEQRERGPELLIFKEIYKNAGFQVTDKELPDYLPLFLEFAGLADENVVLPVLTNYQKNIGEIHNQLAANANVYTVLFDCLFKVIKDLGVDNM
jgi:nitrate reductase delta subunit